MSKELKERIQEFGLELPPPPEPLGVYRPLLVVGSYLYVSCQGPILNNRGLIQGKVGVSLDLEQGKLAARQV